MLAAAGVREARLHDARHTAAPFLPVLGVTERAVMDVMGRSKTTMARRHQHVPDELKHNIASQVAELPCKASAEGDEDGPRQLPYRPENDN